ncbi:MAG: glycoside hydrolase family 2 TIM barrel-domain containing protein, partial [Phycisphaeraceae bacterium]|nr:glycoside hydrolase family 2 TIM barrel-domain containing protein [Phycisphaeraceae bacterium]
LSFREEGGVRRVLFFFGVVYGNSFGLCIGGFVGGRPYGYSSFAYDLTPYLTDDGSAVVAVRVDNSRQPNCRWYSGSGIYRHVWLTITDPVHVAHWGTFVTTPEVDDDRAQVACEVTVDNDGDDEADIEVSAHVLEAPDAKSEPVALTVEPGGSRQTDLRLALGDPTRWSPDQPHLYTLRVEVARDGETIDRYDTRFGVRTIRFDADEGFFLNGESLKFRGVNEHHDAGCLGAAVPDDVARRRLGILKGMGCNAIRIAHNPASPALLDLCDETGFLVVEDAFDEWRAGKKPFGYQLDWDDWWERDLVDMIRRDRNHPSVVMWSVGNEIKEVREGRPEGLPIMADLQATCHREDPTRPMTCGTCTIHRTLEAGYGPLMDVAGYNGGGGSCFDYEEHHAKYPDMVMFASEVPHSLQTRGVYRTKSWYRDLPHKTDLRYIDVPDLTGEEVFPDFDEHYQSSYDNAMVRISSIDSWRRTRDLPYVCGEFRWTGFDYLGECYGWPAKSWNFGVIDLCGFPKDTYFFYQSQWTDTPMVHVLPHWTWPGLEGTDIPAIVYTNCDEVELWLDDRSLGRKARDDDAMQLRWDVTYQPGALRAVGYREGEEAATCEHVTAGAPAGLKAAAVEETIRADGTGVAHVAIDVVDDQGRTVPSAGPDISVDVSGPGRLIGLENGDPLDTTVYTADHRRAFHGRMLAIVQAHGDPGEVTVTARAEGLAEGACRVEAATADSMPG